MRARGVLLSTPLLIIALGATARCSDPDNACTAACDHIEQCIQQISGAQAGKCTLNTSNCVGMQRCVADCILAASCDAIINGTKGVPSDYSRCLGACSGVTPDAAPDAPAGQDSGPDGPLPDSATPEASIPPATKDGAIHLDGAPVKPSPTSCMDTSSEPNNTSATATDLGPAGAGLIPGWEICYPGDVDHFKLSLSAGAKVNFKIVFTHKDGDLDLAALDPSGVVIDTSRSESDNEEVTLTVTQSGTYVFGVLGFGGATNSYDIMLQKQ